MNTKREEPSHKYRVLCVDDQPVSLEKVVIELTWDNIEVDVAFYAPTALKKLTSISYDLIITDANMPEMDGFEFCRSIRAQNIKVPIIVLTAYGDEGIRHELISSGANDVLTKPVLSDKLLHVINRYLQDLHMI